MIVTVVAFPLKSEYGGPPVVVMGVTEELSKMCNVRIVNVGKVDKELFTNHEQVDLYCQSTFTSNLYGLFLRWNSSIKSVLKTTDVLLIHGYYFWSTFRILTMRNLKASIILMPHGVFEPYQQRQSKIRKFLFDNLLRIFQKNCIAEFIVASESEVDGVKMKFKNSRVRVVGIGISSSFLPSIPINRVKLVSSPVKMLHLGRVVEKKRIDLMIGAVSELKKRNIEARLIVAGTGTKSKFSELEVLAQTLGVADRISFIGHVAGIGKSNLLDECDVLLLPSENENFAVSIAEATAFGLPVVVSKHVAMSHFVNLHLTGSVLSQLSYQAVADGVEIVLENYGEFSKNSLESRHLLTYHVIINAWIDVLREHFVDSQ